MPPRNNNEDIVDLRDHWCNLWLVCMQLKHPLKGTEKGSGLNGHDLSLCFGYCVAVVKNEGLDMRSTLWHWLQFSLRHGLARPGGHDDWWKWSNLHAFSQNLGQNTSAQICMSYPEPATAYIPTKKAKTAKTCRVQTSWNLTNKVKLTDPVHLLTHHLLSSGQCKWRLKKPTARQAWQQQHFAPNCSIALVGAASKMHLNGIERDSVLQVMASCSILAAHDSQAKSLKFRLDWTVTGLW